MTVSAHAWPQSEAAAKSCGPARFPPARGNQVARPRAPERQLATARPRDDQPGGSRPSVSNPETGRPSHRPPKIARDPLVHLKRDSYPFEDRDLGRVPYGQRQRLNRPASGANSAARTRSDSRRR